MWHTWIAPEDSVSDGGKRLGIRTGIVTTEYLRQSRFCCVCLEFAECLLHPCRFSGMLSVLFLQRSLVLMRVLGQRFLLWIHLLCSIEMIIFEYVLHSPNLFGLVDTLFSIRVCVIPSRNRTGTHHEAEFFSKRFLKPLTLQVYLKPSSLKCLCNNMHCPFVIKFSSLPVFHVQVKQGESTSLCKSPCFNTLPLTLYCQHLKNSFFCYVFCPTFGPYYFLKDLNFLHDIDYYLMILGDTT